MAPSVPASTPSAKLSFPPRRSFVSLATDFVVAFCAGHTDDEELKARIQLTAHELVENVVKYSCGEVCVVEVSVTSATHEAGSTLFSISTENQVAPEPLVAADAYLRTLEEAASAERFYDARIAESAKRVEGSGLGLARIRAEACMTIRHRVQHGQLRVTAETLLPMMGERNPE